MEFSRMGEHTIRCLITEAEIFDLGYTLEDIMSNGSKAQEFMNRIFAMAERQFQMKFDLGVKTVRADFLPNHILCLTFSEHSPENLLDHIKDIVSGMIGPDLETDIDRLRQEYGEDEEDEEDDKEEPAFGKKQGTDPNAGSKQARELPIDVLFVFDSLDEVVRFAKSMNEPHLPENLLYKLGGQYFLIMNLSKSTKEEVFRLSVVTDEYSFRIQAGSPRRAFIEEHGKVLLKAQALETLKEL